MSTQPSSFPSVPFSVTHPQQHFRLLELPPELLDLLSSENKPATLELKSALLKTSRSNIGPALHNEHLHLCTKDKVWAIRQVSTSNSVYITTPTNVARQPSPPDADAMALDEAPATDTGPAITAISQPTSSLELIPLQTTPATVEAAIRSLLPIHANSNSWNDEDSSLTPSPSPTSSPYSIASLISNLPYPRNILLPTLRNLFVFERHTPEIRAFIPSPHLLLQSWKSFHTTFLLLNTTTQATGADADDDLSGATNDLSTFDVLAAGEITTAIATDEGEVFACVANAIMERFVRLDLSSSDGEDEDEDEEELREMYSLEGPFKGEELSLWLGRLILQCSGGPDDDGGVDTQKFVDEWTGLLPRAWAGYCAVERLGGECVVVEQGKVRWVVEPQVAQKGARTTEEGGKATATATAAGKRKWHEKFAKERSRK